MRDLQKAVFEFGISRFARQRPTSLGALSAFLWVTGHVSLLRSAHTHRRWGIDSKRYCFAQVPKRAPQKRTQSSKGRRPQPTLN
jgi:hypothetical protein